MRGVTQRIEGWPTGECVRASYATLFQVPIEQIPRLDPGAAMVAGEQQGDRERAWLNSIGYDLVEFGVNREALLEEPMLSLDEEDLAEVPEVLHLMSGVSPRGFGHRCVGFGGELVWDPHPSRAGLVTVYSIGLVVPLERTR